MGFKAIVTLTLDLDTEAEKDALEAAEKLIANIMNESTVVRKQIRIEKTRKRNCLIRLGEYKPEEVLDYITYEDTKREYKIGDNSYMVKMNSHRYFIFRESTNCVACGLEGTKMILEHNQFDKSPHFNLYGLKDGKLILMTKDHVQPKAYGGEDRHSNYQTMCSVCNNLKGSANLTLDGVREIRAIFDENQHLPRKKLSEKLDAAKRRLSIKHVQPRITKRRRGEHLATCKVGETVFCNTDIHIWQNKDGTLYGKSVYSKPSANAVQIACIKHGTELQVVGADHNKVIVMLNEQPVKIYQGYLDVKENFEPDKE